MPGSHPALQLVRVLVHAAPGRLTDTVLALLGRADGPGWVALPITTLADLVPAVLQAGIGDLVLLIADQAAGITPALLNEPALRDGRPAVVVLDGPTAEYEWLKAGAVEVASTANLNDGLEPALRRALTRNQARHATEGVERLRGMMLAGLPRAAFLLVDGAGRVLLAEGRSLADFAGPLATPGNSIGQVFGGTFGRQLAELVHRAFAGASATIECSRRDRSFLVTVAPLAGTTGPQATAIAAWDLTEQRSAVVEAFARERSAVVGVLASGIGHEFNDVHTVIIGQLDQLSRRAAGDAALADRLSTIRNAALRAAAAAGSLLTFAAGARAGSPSGLDLASTVDATAAVLRHELDTAGVQLLTRYEPISPALAPAPVVGQVGLTLLINALHALLGQPIRRIDVTTFRQEGMVGFTVVDTGRGLSGDELARIFVPSFGARSDHRGDDGPPGAGVGLAVCRHLVEALGGSLTATSVLGKGSEFTVTLPAAEMRDESGATAMTMPVSDDQGSILVVEDDPLLRDLLHEVFHERGWQVELAEDGLAGLQHATARTFDAILFDMQMPRMGGTEFVERLAALRPLDGPALVAMSGNPNIDLRHARIHASLRKPFDLDTVCNLMATVIRGRHRPPAGPK